MTKHLHVHDENGNPEVVAWFDDFDGVHEYASLSNFYEGAPLRIPHFAHEPFATGEHAYAAMKTLNEEQFERIHKSRSPGEAKALGQACDLRPDWEAVKYDVMLTILREKFTLERAEGEMLLGTGDALLIEGTYWEDMVWGVALFNDRDPLNAPGRNWLGTMLMARRAELKAEQMFGHRHQTGAYNAIFATRK